MTRPGNGRPDDGRDDEGTPLRPARSGVHPDDAPDDLTPSTDRGGEADTGAAGAATPADEPPAGSDARPGEADRLQTGDS